MNIIICRKYLALKQSTVKYYCRCYLVQ